jgi:multiple sugar transport system ATP-binding protein
MSSITLSHVTKRFDKVIAVSDLSLEIGDREFMVLLGPSGAGKTTTLRCVAGLETLTGGDVLLDGTSTKGVPPALRDLAFVFQSYALYPRMSAYENIASPLRARGMRADEIDGAVRVIAAKLHIEHLLQRKPAQLSGGEQQRVALCRAMVRQPRGFLMDEPLTNLDFKLRVEMRTELKRLHREMNTTLFYVTNDQHEAMSLADRIAVLNKGVLQQAGSAMEVYERPANLFVATFIGTPRMTLLDGTITDSVITGNDGWRLPLPSAHIPGATKVKLGIRPEDVSILPDSPVHSVSNIDAPAAPVVPGRVFVTEELGDRTIVDVRLNSGLIVKVKAPPTFSCAQDNPVWLKLNSARTHVFDAASGVRINV